MPTLCVRLRRYVYLFGNVVSDAFNARLCGWFFNWQAYSLGAEIMIVEITDEMIDRAARALDRRALRAQGWTAPAIQRVMTEVKQPAEISVETAKAVLFAAFTGEERKT